MLKQVERGEMTADAFMEGIAVLIRDLIRQNTAPDPAYSSLFGSKNAANREAVGTCPRCGGAVYEGKKGFFCENEACAFALWKENRFFSSKKKTITKTVAAALLKEGRVSMSGLFSEKTGKTYDATLFHGSPQDSKEETICSTHTKGVGVLAHTFKAFGERVAAE